MAAQKSPETPSREQLEQLYLEPPEGFIRARDKLARSLRDDGNSEAAREVKKYRRPSAAAWLVNQLALREPGAVEQLLAVGTRLRDAEDAMLAGQGDASELRARASEERESIDRLTESARRIASSADRKLSQATADRVGETLQAAAADPMLAERVRAGRLDKEVRTATIGVSTRAPARGKRRKAGRAAKDSAERERERLELDAARRDVERAEARRERAEADVEQQAQRLKEARAALADAKREARRSAASLKRLGD